MKKILFFITLFLFGGESFAQNEYIAYPATGKGVSSTFVTDYHALGINPANLGWKKYDDHSMTMGSSEFGMSVYSESLSKNELRSTFNSVLFGGQSVSDLSNDEKLAVIEGFASDFAFNFDYNAFGFSYQNDKFGGIAFSMRTRASWNSRFNDEFSDLLFRGKTASYFDSLTYFDGVDTSTIANSGNVSVDTASRVVSGTASIPLNLSELLNGSYLKFSLNREFHFGYGRKIIDIDSVFTLYAGVGARYIQGIAIMDLRADEDGLEMYSAISPGFNIDYGAVALSNPSTLAATGAKFFKKPIGNGYGIDVGLNATLFGRLHLAASITNVGSMTYTGDLYTVKDTLVIDYSSEGLQDLNVTEAPAELLEESGLLNIQGSTEKTIKSPGQFRMGASIELGKFVELGGELVAPFNDVPGNVDGFAYGLGGDFKLFGGKVILMTGMTGGGGYDTQLPLGVNFVLREGRYECGIASRDFYTFFTENSPTLSTAFGFARIRF